ncbi:translocation/assembly module TamB domain-containing protein [Robertkochia marina]|uniref:translocation/assembly module TamB domain-containing protein n=1 Tax=Robertkochia marina TaxID=1227945 RepID=UPI001F54EAB6|nr:translocation/assembly module TamB domain-containing protein [Robertkochia marina]
MLRLVLVLLGLIVLTGTILSLPPVQTKLAQKATTYLNDKYNTNINVEKVKISVFFGDVTLNNVYIEDYKQDTLIYAEDLRTSLLNIKRLTEGNLELGGIEAQNLIFKVITYEGETNSNLDVFVEKLDSGPSDPNAPPFELTSPEVDIEGGQFLYIDKNKESAVILDLKDINAEVEDLKIMGPKVYVPIDRLSFNTSRGLNVEHLRGDFQYTKQGMSLEGMELQTQNSEINGDIWLTYNREDFSEFFDKVQFKGAFTDSQLSLDEINFYYNEFGKGKRVAFSTAFEGVLNDLTLKDAFLRSGNTEIAGDFVFHNLLNSDRNFSMEADLDKASSNYFQLRSLMPRILGEVLPENFKRFGQFSVGGRIELNEENIYSRISVTTEKGKGYTDLTLTNYDNIEEAAYNGFVSLTDFDLGGFLEDPKLGLTSMDVNIDGSGFKKEVLNTEIIGQIFELTYNGYEYNDLSVSGILKDQLFDGSLTSRDPNFDVDFKGLADLSGTANEFNFVASVSHADLKRLNFLQRDSVAIFKGRINMNVVGNNLDDFEGVVRFSNTEFMNQNDTYYFNDFNITSDFIDGERVLKIDSPDIITGTVEGVFKVNELGNLVSNSIGSIYTNYSPYEISKGQYLDFNLNIYNKIVEVFFPEVRFGSNTFIKGSMSADDGDFKLIFRSPHIDAYGTVFDTLNVNIDNKNPLFNTFVEVNKIESGSYDVSDFSLINTKIQDTLFFRTEFKGGDEFNDEYNLNFYHTFNADQRSVIGLKRSVLGLKGNDWVINEKNDHQNKVTFNRTLDSIVIDQLVMNYGEEEILLEGTLIDTTSKDIDLEFNNVSLENITPDIDSLDMRGTINGNLNILQRNNNYVPSSNVKIADFEVNGYKLGNFFVSIIGNRDLTSYDVNVKVVDDARERMLMIGQIVYENKEARLNLNTRLDGFVLDAFSPLGGIVLSDLRGTAHGQFKITGPLKNPEMNGTVELMNAGLKIPYLNLDLDLNQMARIGLDKQSILFNDLVLTDKKYKTQATLDGSINHNGFSDWYLDLNLASRGNRFLVLDTEAGNDELYYGTAFISGAASITGLTDELLNIEVDARTEKGTVFKIPISDETEIGDLSFINFKEKSNGSESTVRELKEVQGLELFFDLDVTPEAEVEIVIDEKTGSSLKGSGAGNMLIEINTNGKFNMWGDFITSRGEYNFKYGGFIDKKFNVEPNGTIVWNGDPLQADVNITAVYSLYANPSVLLDNAQYTRKIETEVVINMLGELVQPTFDYEINFPTASAVTNSELQYRLDDNTKREMQAFSLLSQGAFINDVSLTQQAVTGNLVQTASSMFNQILNSGDGVFDVGVSYEIGERNPNQDFVTDDRLGVTVSTQINDRILVNGKIGMPIGGVSESVVAGNVEVQILLNDDGTLSATIFNRENEIRQFFAQEQGYTQGVGLSYQVEFDTFRELFQKLLGQEKEPESEKNPAGDAGTASKKEKKLGDGMVTIRSKN